MKVECKLLWLTNLAWHLVVLALRRRMQATRGAIGCLGDGNGTWLLINGPDAEWKR